MFVPDKMIRSDSWPYLKLKVKPSCERDQHITVTNRLLSPRFSIKSDFLCAIPLQHDGTDYRMKPWPHLHTLMPISMECRPNP